MRVTVANSPRGFEVAPHESILDAALAASWNLPHSCRGGNCGACRARLLAGAIAYPNGPPLGLSEAEVASGEILLCQARARSNLTLELIEQHAPHDITVKRLPCRIERLVPWSHDVMGVYLKLPAAEEFSFRAGQYLDILLASGQRRSFSIASPPHDAQPLELHVRQVAGGAFSDRLFHENLQGSLLQIEGPLGQFYYRDTRAGEAAPPLLLVGGGTGLAPLLSILRHISQSKIDRDMHLYWGVRSQRDLYAQARILQLLESSARLHYVPVLSEPDIGWPGRRGLVHTAVAQDCAAFGAPGQLEVYAAGPPAMIRAVREECALRGVAPQRLYFDAFDYASDPVRRQPSNADTKS